MRSRRSSTKVRAAALALCALLPGCFTVTHTVGAGPATSEKKSVTHWWVGWGLFSLGEVPDSNTLAKGAADYRVTTGFTFNDVLISAIPSILSFYRQSITVER